LGAIADSVSFDQVVQYLESHTVISIIAVVLVIAVLFMLFKIARWVLRPVLKGVLAGGIVLAGLYFLTYKEILTLTTNMIILIAVVLFMFTAIADLNRKK